MKIYVLHHCTFEDTNVFFTDPEVAKTKLLEFMQKYNTSEEEWSIDTIEEGEVFQADFLLL